MDKNTEIALKYILNKVDPYWHRNEEIAGLFKSSKFAPPTQKEVELYLKEQGYQNPRGNAETFWNFYESKGWMVGKNKMKSWKSAIKTWKFDKNNLIL